VGDSHKHTKDSARSAVLFFSARGVAACPAEPTPTLRMLRRPEASLERTKGIRTLLDAAAESGDDTMYPAPEQDAENAAFQGVADVFKFLQDKHLGDEGIEHPPLALSKTAISETASAKGGAPNAENTPLDPDLALIQDRWTKLPEHIRQAVLALVRSTSGKEQAL
jgi:hypothetical protein